MDYIQIEGYKSIKNQRVDLSPVNILIGANGSGKSNFISFFDFLNRLYNRELQEYVALIGGADKLLHKGQKITNSISFKVEFDEGQNGYSAVLKSGNAGFIFTEEKLYYQQDSGKEIGNYEKEAKIKTLGSLRSKYIVNYLDRLRMYHFHDTSYRSAFNRSSNIHNDNYYLYSDGGNLAAYLYHIHDTHRIVYNKILKTIQSIAPYFSDFFLRPNQSGYINLMWKDKTSEIIYGATDLSDGTIRFIALTVLFMQPELPDTIIIDEPELGLHPSAIAKLAGMIKSAAHKGSQIILATQSTDLISHFSPEDILTADQIEGETQFKRLSEKELHSWLEDYTIDDLWKRNIISTGQPNF